MQGTQVRVEAMQRADVKRFVCRASATVYGDSHARPIRAGFPIRTTVP